MLPIRPRKSRVELRADVEKGCCTRGESTADVDALFGGAWRARLPRLAVDCTRASLPGDGCLARPCPYKPEPARPLGTPASPSALAMTAFYSGTRLSLSSPSSSSLASFPPRHVVRVREINLTRQTVNATSPSSAPANLPHFPSIPSHMPRPAPSKT